MKIYASVIPASILFTLTLSQNVPLRGPPQFENNPQYLDSYIPASMQVIAYLTEMMKYDIKPIVATTTTSTTRRPIITTTRRPVTLTPSRVTTKRPLYTAPPTPYHKPALYAPYIPPSFIISRTPAESSSSDVDSYEAYVNRLKNPLGNYFDRYRQVVDPISSIIDQLKRQRRATPFVYEPEVKNASDAASRSSRIHRATPFNNTQNARQQPGLRQSQTFNSLRSRNQPAPANGQQRPQLARANSAGRVVEPQRPQLARSRSARSLPASLNVNINASEITDSANAKARALTINGDNFNARGVDYLGFGLNELIKEIQSEREGVDNQLTDDDRVKSFSTKYDDVNFGSYLLRQKKIPPTKAYVTLLSLYDLLNKESKKLMLNKYNGYATAIIDELIETSTGTSSEQLRIILQRIVDRPDTSDPTIKTKITSLVTDLATTNSYINDALRYIPPLPFSR